MILFFFGIYLRYDRNAIPFFAFVYPISKEEVTVFRINLNVYLQGYELSEDFKTCKDIDECATVQV